MIALAMTIENEKVVIAGLSAAGAAIPVGASAGMGRVAAGIFGEAFKKLQGPARSRVRIFTNNDKRYARSGKRTRVQSRGRTESIGARPGSYPVPRVTSHLLTRLSYIGTNESRSDNGKTFATGTLESMVFNAADYASVIRDGTHSSSKYGARPFDTDAVIAYDGNGNIAAVMNEEIQKAIDDSGIG